MSLMGIVSGLIAPRVMIIQEHGVNGQTLSVIDTGIGLNIFFANWYILNIHLCPSFPLSYHKCILLKTSFIRQHDPQFSSQRARSSPWWEGSRPWDSCWSSCWKFSAPRPRKEAPPITRALKKGQTKLYLWSKKNTCLYFLDLTPLSLILGGRLSSTKLETLRFPPSPCLKQ